MCAIVGILNLNRKLVDRKVLWEMTDALRHRGPDDRGIYIDKYVGLGHRRLSIIDLSERAHQPMTSEDGIFTIIYNGEIYNFREIRDKLEREGIRFRSCSDTEVVLKSFARWGVSALSLFNGMFTFAIWDKENRILTLARDRYGVKPLYYLREGKVFIFASEIKAFFRYPDFFAGVDPAVILEYFTFQNTFTYRTLFKNVKVFPPGYFLQISFTGKETITMKQYWDFHFKEDRHLRGEEEYLEELDRLFRQAVRRQLISDVEVGSYLSGGVDSGAIVAIASKYLKGLKTFCIGFDLSSASGLELSCDERKKSERVSYLYQTEQYEMVLKSGDMQKNLPSIVWSLEDLRLGQCYPNFYAAKLASQFVKVCLSGAGGDELFGGYPWRYYATFKNNNFNEYINGYYGYWQRLVSFSALKKLFSPIRNEIKGIDTKDIFRAVFNNCRFIPQGREDYINHSLYFEAKTFLHGLLIVEDKLSMFHGLETRVPFLDNDLVSFALKIPVRLKLKNAGRIIKIDEDGLAKRDNYFKKMRDGKVILRKVLHRYVEKGIINQAKQGFSGPDASWFRGESIDYVKAMLLDRGAHIYRYLDYKTARSLINDHIEGRYNRRLFIWSLLCFEWWLKIFIAKETSFLKNA
jgi:asparagine synthase (glutamine-hydrolysing)